MIRYFSCLLYIRRIINRRIYYFHLFIKRENKMSFKGKVVIVTGASSGIGASTALAFAAEGAKVVIVGRNETKLKNVSDKCEKEGSKPLVVTADVSKNEDIKRIMKETLNHFGKLDILVNNAGIYSQAGILAPNAMEVHELVMSTNLQSTVYLTHLAAPHLVETKGNIVNVSSISGLGVMPVDSFSYLTSKAAMDHFSRAIALELAPKGVRVNTVNPGAVKTDILMNSVGVSSEQSNAAWDEMAKLAPLRRFGEPEEIADLILFLASDKARSITGSSFVSDNGALMVSPSKLPF